MNRSCIHVVLIYTLSSSGNPDVMILNDTVNRSQNMDVMIYRDTVNMSRELDVIIYMMNRSWNLDDLQRQGKQVKKSRCHHLQSEQVMKSRCHHLQRHGGQNMES